jgi:hypothetical protein
VAIRTPDSPRLPQPGWRLLGFASIGLGAGLFTADAPFVVLAAAFVPALVAMMVIAVQGATGTTNERVTVQEVGPEIER